MWRSAVISEDQKYRYMLFRTWNEDNPFSDKVMNFVMLNPSTADADNDDPTIRKCIGFAKQNGFNAIRVVNLFAFRATDPKELQAEYVRGGDIVGPDNNDYVRGLPAEETVIAAWGSTHKNEYFWKRRVEETKKLLDRPIGCLRKTIDGNPWHPLYVPYGPILEF